MTRNFRKLIAFVTRKETRRHNANVMRRLERAGRAIPPLTDEARERMKGKVDRGIAEAQLA